MQDSGLSGLTINSKCSLLSSLVSKCMKSGLLQELAMNPFDAADYSAELTTSTQQSNRTNAICRSFCRSSSIDSSSLS